MWFRRYNTTRLYEPKSQRVFIRAQKAEFFGRPTEFGDEVERFGLRYVALELDKRERFEPAVGKGFYLRDVKPRPRKPRQQ